MKQKESDALRTVLLIGGGLLVYRAIAGDEPDPYITDAPVVTVDPTMTAEQARILAEQVASAIYGGSFWSGWPFGSLTEDEDAVVAAMTNDTVRNDADVLLIADAYGRRGEFATPNYTLPQAIRAYLEPSDIAAINETYRARGINIRF